MLQIICLHNEATQTNPSIHVDLYELELSDERLSCGQTYPQTLMGPSPLEHLLVLALCAISHDTVGATIRPTHVVEELFASLYRALVRVHVHVQSVGHGHGHGRGHNVTNGVKPS